MLPAYHYEVTLYTMKTTFLDSISKCTASVTRFYLLVHKYNSYYYVLCMSQGERIGRGERNRTSISLSIAMVGMFHFNG